MVFLRRLAVTIAFLLAATHAHATPLLQLDILGGHYDPLTQTIVSDGPDFTLVALLTPRLSAGPLETLLGDTYYISAAVTPAMGSTGATIGSFSWNGTSYGVTGDMTFGTPPLEGAGAIADEGDLAAHSVFPTFFSEFAFQFSSANRTETYDTAQNPGGLAPTSATTGVSYFQTFNLSTALEGNYALHFDLYDTYIKGCSLRGSCGMDVDLEHFAPFSHDAESSAVPEPATMGLVGAGLALAMMVRARGGIFAARGHAEKGTV